MAKNKTTETEVSVDDFIAALDSEQRKKDSYTLIKLMEQITGHPPKMWGPTIIGFGRYEYRYESGHSGEAPVLGFSPRKAAISLYVFSGLEEHFPLLEGLGHKKVGKVCVYASKVADLDMKKLEKLCRVTIDFVNTTYGNPTGAGPK